MTKSYNCMYLIPQPLFSSLVDNLDSKSSSALQIRQLNNLDVGQGGKVTIRNDDKIVTTGVGGRRQSDTGGHDPSSPPQPPHHPAQPPDVSGGDSENSRISNSTTFSTTGANNVSITRARNSAGMLDANVQTNMRNDIATSTDEAGRNDMGMQTDLMKDVATSAGNGLFPYQRDYTTQTNLARDVATSAGEGQLPEHNDYMTQTAVTRDAWTGSSKELPGHHNNRTQTAVTRDAWTGSSNDTVGSNDAITQVWHRPSWSRNAGTETHRDNSMQTAVRPPPYFADVNTQTSIGRHEMSNQTTPIRTGENETSTGNHSEMQSQTTPIRTGEIDTSTGNYSDMQSQTSPIRTGEDDTLSNISESSNTVPKWLAMDDVSTSGGRRDIFSRRSPPRSPPPVRRQPPNPGILARRGRRIPAWEVSRQLPKPPAADADAATAVNQPRLYTRSRKKVVKAVVPKPPQFTRSRKKVVKPVINLKRKKVSKRVPKKRDQAAATDEDVADDGQAAEVSAKRATKRKSKGKTTLSRRSKNPKQPRNEYPMWMR